MGIRTREETFNYRYMMTIRLAKCGKLIMMRKKCQISPTVTTFSWKVLIILIIRMSVLAVRKREIS
ncbi:hypothetical protein PRIPAC_76571, partial [Pristionchus pacificus]